MKWRFAFDFDFEAGWVIRKQHNTHKTRYTGQQKQARKNTNLGLARGLNQESGLWNPSRCVFSQLPFE